jgi:hypothetical protein
LNKVIDGSIIFTTKPFNKINDNVGFFSNMDIWSFS